MKQITKLSHKQLKDWAQSLNAYYFTGNIYQYENDVYCLQTLNKAPNYAVDKAVLSVVNDILTKYPNAHHCHDKQLAYSCGIYGNTGQLHQLNIIANDYETILDTIYTYC